MTTCLFVLQVKLTNNVPNRQAGDASQMMALMICPYLFLDNFGLFCRASATLSTNSSPELGSLYNCTSVFVWYAAPASCARAYAVTITSQVSPPPWVVDIVVSEEEQGRCMSHNDRSRDVDPNLPVLLPREVSDAVQHFTRSVMSCCPRIPRNQMICPSLCEQYEVKDLKLCCCGPFILAIIKYTLLLARSLP